MKNLANKLKKIASGSVGSKPPKKLKNTFLISTNFSFIIFLLFFLLGFILRLYKLDQPLGDWHSWRQADTAAVTWFLNKDFDLLHPHFFDVSNIPSGQDNPQGYRFVEFPIYNLIHLSLFKVISIFPYHFHYPFEVAGRLSSVTMWLIGSIFLYYLLTDLANPFIAISSTFFYLFLPYAIYYSRTILPGPTTISLSIVSLYYWTKLYSKNNFLYFVLVTFFTALAILTKPYAAFIIGLYPLGLIILKRKKLSQLLIYLSAGVLSLVPFLLWRKWMLAYPAGIPANKWLLNEGGMRLKPVWWRWLFYERIAKLILGGWGSGFLFAALLVPLRKNKFQKLFTHLVLSIITGSFLYLVIFARGNIQHDYYQIMILPALSLSLGIGSYFIFTFISQSSKTYPIKSLIGSFFLLFTSFSLLFSWYQVKEYYHINDLKTIKVIEKIKNTIPPQSKIITDYQGNSLLLYHFKHLGWPAMTTDIKTLHQKGADFYFSPTANKTSDKLLKICKNVKRIKGTILINLNSCNYVQN